MQLIKNHLSDIKILCRKNGVDTLFTFGSIIADKKLKYDSDVDLIVTINDSNPLSYSDKYFNLKFGLEEILGRPIDLLESKAIRNPVLLEEIEKNKRLIYG
ncbi:MAG: nucleotidyltransferase domain-containing protein [Cyclobacteriaceae bacterium]|nr:nucleotidyltransferase domain-containing protein [Cyclobacteriaceae bacterium HetDA_MAG_MS6]